MKKITRKELCELCKKSGLISSESTEAEFIIECDDDYYNADCTEEIIDLTEALGVEVVDCDDSRLISDLQEKVKGLELLIEKTKKRIEGKNES